LKYINWDGLKYFLDKILETVMGLLSDKVSTTDLVETTDAEIDEICGAEVVADGVSY